MGSRSPLRFRRLSSALASNARWPFGSRELLAAVNREPCHVSKVSFRECERAEVRRRTSDDGVLCAESPVMHAMVAPGATRAHGGQMCSAL